MGILWNIGNGRKVRFWWDGWVTKTQPLIFYAVASVPNNIINKIAAEFVDGNGNWQWGSFDSLPPNNILLRIASFQPPMFERDEDQGLAVSKFEEQKAVWFRVELKYSLWSWLFGSFGSRPHANTHSLIRPRSVVSGIVVPVPTRHYCWSNNLPVKCLSHQLESSPAVFCSNGMELTENLKLCTSKKKFFVSSELKILDVNTEAISFNFSYGLSAAVSARVSNEIGNILYKSAMASLQILAEFIQNSSLTIGTTFVSISAILSSVWTFSSFTTPLDTSNLTK
ncbi:hypothetical protein WN944_001547 [Citrus x changshan-huyou]|uniref:Uncharacterized protein n=1 Tax=Citrus x changshan-huyou TaxID=2935761 RepID=A0AAP0MGL5_9ROSI